MVITELTKQRGKLDGDRPRKINWLSLEQDVRDALEIYKQRCSDGFSSPGEHGIMADEILAFISDSLGWHTGRGYVLESNEQR
jgi:hypothetical protein